MMMMGAERSPHAAFLREVQQQLVQQGQVKREGR